MHTILKIALCKQHLLPISQWSGFGHGEMHAGQTDDVFGFGEGILHTYIL